MSATTTSLSDTLPSSVPKLESTSTNWAIFKIRFCDAIEAKGFWGHFNGLSLCPVAISINAPNGTTTMDTAPVDQWEKDEHLAKSLLNQKIPDSTLMHIQSKTSVEECWKAIEKEYTEKGAYMQTELRQKFLESKCQDKANVWEFLDSLQVKREELAAVGVDIEEKDYRSTILSSLPISLANFTSAQLAAAQMYSPTKTLDPDVLIGEEFDCQRMQQLCWYGGKSKDDNTDEAMAVNPSFSKGKGSKGGARKPQGVCWNCGETGHYKDKCPKPKVNKAKDDSAKKEKTSGSANAAAECKSNSESDGAWVASHGLRLLNESHSMYVDNTKVLVKRSDKIFQILLRLLIFVVF